MNKELIEDYMKFESGKFDKELEEDIKIYDIAKKDKDIKDILRQYSLFEKLIRKHSKSNNSKKIEDINRLRSFKNSYVTLAYMRKQERMTKHIIFLTYLMLFSVLAQIIIFLFK